MHSHVAVSDWCRLAPMLPMAGAFRLQMRHVLERGRACLYLGTLSFQTRVAGVPRAVKI
jgi:hypothetical protein